MRRSEKPIIVVSLSSTCSAREYPLVEWGELVGSLTGWADVLLFDLWPLPREVRNVYQCISLSLETIAALLPLLDLHITVDTMFVHLGAATGVRTLGVFGPTNGNAVCMAYPNVTVINGVGETCYSACHYRKSAGWKPDLCLSNGCERMRSLSPSLINSTAKNIVKQYNSLSTRN